MFTISPHPQKMRNYGLKALLCTRIVFLYTTRATGNQLNGLGAEPFEMNAKVELGSNFVVDNENPCLRNLKR